MGRFSWHFCNVTSAHTLELGLVQNPPMADKRAVVYMLSNFFKTVLLLDVISFLVYWALTISVEGTLETEIAHLTEALTKNGYNKTNIHRTIQKLRNKPSSPIQAQEPDREQKKPEIAVLAHVECSTDRISRILGKHNIKLTGSIQDILYVRKGLHRRNREENQYTH